MPVCVLCLDLRVSEHVCLCVCVVSGPACE